MEREPIRIDVYVRAYASVSGPRDHVVELVDDLSERGIVADYDVHTWPSAVDLAVPSGVTRRYHEFRDWAEATDASLEPAFLQQYEENRITGEYTEKLVTPLVCTAVRRGDELVAVLPCCRGEDRHVTVLEYLSALAEGDDPLDDAGLSTASVA